MPAIREINWTFLIFWTIYLLGGSSLFIYLTIWVISNYGLMALGLIVAVIVAGFAVVGTFIACKYPT